MLAAAAGSVVAAVLATLGMGAAWEVVGAALKVVGTFVAAPCAAASSPSSVQHLRTRLYRLRSNRSSRYEEERVCVWWCVLVFVVFLSAVRACKTKPHRHRPPTTRAIRAPCEPLARNIKGVSVQQRALKDVHVRRHGHVEAQRRYSDQPSGSRAH